ncbi:MAG: hypothetical protein GX868_17810 [Actinobacteria bacterium]|nr:hypothetical protein [Actinomycetota bacterium]
MSELVNTHDADSDDNGGELAALRSFAPRHGGTPVEWEKPPSDLFARISKAVQASERPAVELVGQAAEVSTADTATAQSPTASVAGVEAPKADAPAPELPGTDLSGAAASGAELPGAEPSGAEASDAEPTDNVRSLEDRRGAPRRRFPWELAAAAAVAAIAIAAGIVSQTSKPSESLVASTALDRLAGDGSGRAELVDIDGSMQLRLDTTGLDSGDGYLEVWVIDPSVSKLVSLGPFRDDGRYDVPASVDMHEFPIVDVSIEPPDGNPSHSGNSVLRGQLSI